MEIKIAKVFGRIAVFIFLCVGASHQVVAANCEKPHRFTCTDYTQGKIFIVSATRQVEWEYTAEHCNDIAVLPNGNLLFNTGHGACEVTWTKEIVFKYESRSAVYACQRLSNGNTLVGECEAGRLLEVSPKGEIVREVRLLPEGKDGGGAYMRNARQLENGHFLVAHYGEKVVAEYDADGRRVWDVPAPGGPHSVERLSNGNTIISCGDRGAGARIFEVDKAGRTVWEVRDGDLPGVKLKFLAGFQRLKNGNIIVANWLGHGDLTEAPQLIEFTPDRRVVWTFAAPEKIKTISSLQILGDEQTP